MTFHTIFAILMVSLVSLTTQAAGISGPLKKFPFHQDGYYSRETTSTVMGMTHNQKGDVCFHQGSDDYKGHIPDATKCTTEIVKDTAIEGSWKAQCVLESGDKVKILMSITHVDKDTVRGSYDIDAPQGVKVTGQHIFKFLNAKCPPKSEEKAKPAAGNAAGPSDCDKYKNAMATCKSIPANFRSQCESAMKKTNIQPPPGCKI